MATITISLPAPALGWIEQQISAGRFSGPSEYVRELIRRDQWRAEKQRELRGLISDEGDGDGERGLYDGAAARRPGERDD